MTHLPTRSEVLASHTTPDEPEPATEIDRLFLAMDRERDDWVLRSVLADWLEEQGDPRAEAVRWMAANEKRAYQSSHSAVWTSEAERFFVPPVSRIPVAVFDHLEAKRIEVGKQYPTWLAAEAAFHAAFAAARAEGWEPEKEGRV